jgi:hypothetical protein
MTAAGPEAARELKITVPDSLLAQVPPTLVALADEVIE